MIPPEGQDTARRQRRIPHGALIIFCTLVVIPSLYILRAIDDNSLTSWRWVFSRAGLPVYFLLLSVGISGGYILSGLPFSGSSFHLFAFSCLVFMPLSQEPEIIIDASRYFMQAKYLEEYGVIYFWREWGRAIHAWTDMPLIPFLYGLIFRFLGESRHLIQIFTAGLFSSTVVLTYRIGRDLWDEDTGFHAGLLLMGMPYLLVQTPLMLVDVPTMFFLTLSIYSFLVALRRGGTLPIVICSAVLFMTVFTKYSTVIMLPVLCLISIIFIRQDARKVIGRSVAVVLGAAVPAMAVIYLKRDVIYRQIELLRTFQLSGLGWWQESHVSTFLFQIHPFITVAAVYSIYRAVLKKDRLFLIAGWFAVFPVLFQIQRIRYVLPLFPLLALMASYGINDISEAKTRRFLSFCIVAASLSLTLAVYLPFLKATSMANLKSAGEYLDTLPGDAFEVYALPQLDSSGSTMAAVPLLDYYTRKKIITPQNWTDSEKDVSKSSLRFTWEMGTPPFYAGPGGSVTVPLVSLGSRPGPLLPRAAEGYSLSKTFGLSSGVFKYQIFLSVYEREKLSNSGQR